MSSDNLYSQSLRSSVIVGGALALCAVIGLIKIKMIAVLLAPAGVGLIGLYMSIVGLVGTLTTFGLQTSAVRAVAHADALGDSDVLARVVSALHVLSWVTGILGGLTALALALPLRKWVFESDVQANAVVTLSAILLFNAVSNARLARLQGLRQIHAITRTQVLAAALSAIVAVAVYLNFGEDGIMIALLADALVLFAVSGWFARRTQAPRARLPLRDLIVEAKPMLGLGMAIVWSGLLTVGSDLFIRALVARSLGLSAAGVYHAAWILSTLFTGFLLNAMATDFYPRLTSVINDRDETNLLVNTQTEIGVLVALPSVLFTLALNNWLIPLLFSNAFSDAAGALAWMVFGACLRTFVWPLGFLQLSFGAGRSFMLTEAIFFGAQVILVVWLLPSGGVLSIGYAIAASSALYTAVMVYAARRLGGIVWSRQVWRTVGTSLTFLLVTLALNRLLPELTATLLGCLVSLVASAWCARALIQRVGHSHSAVKVLMRLPLIARLLRGLT